MVVRVRQLWYKTTREMPPDTSRVQPHLQEQFQKATSAHVNGEYQEAAIIVNALIQKSPNTADF